MPRAVTAAELAPFRHRTELRVRFAETDAQGVVYNGDYVTYLEVARVEYMRDLGALNKSRPDDDNWAVVAETNVRYHAPARFDEVLTLHTRVARIRRSSMKVETLITRDDGGERPTLIAEGYVILVEIERESGRPVRVRESRRRAVIEYEGENVVVE